MGASWSSGCPVRNLKGEKRDLVKGCYRVLRAFIRALGLGSVLLKPAFCSVENRSIAHPKMFHQETGRRKLGCLCSDGNEWMASVDRKWGEGEIERVVTRAAHRMWLERWAQGPMQVMDRTWLSVPIDLVPAYPFPCFSFYLCFWKTWWTMFWSWKENPCGLGERRNINKVKNLDGFCPILGCSTWNLIWWGIKFCNVMEMYIIQNRQKARDQVCPEISLAERA